MCGIIGFHRSSLPRDQHEIVGRKMLQLIRHRGPDQAGLVVDHTLTMGTARLAVIDLESGEQPLRDPSGRFWIAYNGEVYNYIELRSELEALGHVFVTRSDTEVVLHAYLEWKEDAFARLNGGYAFAIHDRLTGELVLVRDRYGKRPLFYWRRGRELAFASEMKAFLAYEPVSFEWDVDELSTIAAAWTPVREQTGYRDIYQVPQGSFLRCTKSDSVVSPYYAMSVRHETYEIGEDDAVAETKAILTHSVRIRLRSDVEVGTYLSGGLDSSIVTLLASRESEPRRIRSFSISFVDDQFDEAEDQHLVHDLLGTDHFPLRVSNEDISEAFSDALWHGETPVFRTAFVPMFLLSEVVHNAGIKVVLTGEGSDEAFLGYDIFREALLRAKLAHGISEKEEQRLLSHLYPYVPHFNSDGLGGIGRFLRSFTTGLDSPLFSHDLRFSNSRLALRLLRSPENPLAPLKQWIMAAQGFEDASIVSRAQWLEYQTLLAGYLLSTQGDRAALAHSVENRCPFLDPSVVEWGGRLPIEMKLRNGITEKYVLKQAFSRELPQSLVGKPKRPFVAPDAAPFQGKLKRYYLEDILGVKALSRLPFLDVRIARRLAEKVLNTPPDKVSPRESQAFLFLLSTTVLHGFFVERRAPVNHQDLMPCHVSRPS